MKTGKKKQPNTGKARTFFLVYFSVITLILLWNLFHCTEVSWITADAAAAVLSEESKEEKDSAEGGVWELKDDTPLTVQAQADPGTKLKVTTDDILYDYTFKASTNMVVEIATITFLHPEKRC